MQGNGPGFPPPPAGPWARARPRPPPRGSPRQPHRLPGGSRCQSPGPAAAAAATLTRKRTWKRNVPEGGEQGPGLSAEAVAGGSAVSTLAEAKESRAGPWLAWVGRRVSGPPWDSPSSRRAAPVTRSWYLRSRDREGLSAYEMCPFIQKAESVFAGAQNTRAQPLWPQGPAVLSAPNAW